MAFYQRKDSTLVGVPMTVGRIEIFYEILEKENIYVNMSHSSLNFGSTYELFVIMVVSDSGRVSDLEPMTSELGITCPYASHVTKATVQLDLDVFHTRRYTRITILESFAFYLNIEIDSLRLCDSSDIMDMLSASVVIGGGGNSVAQRNANTIRIQIVIGCGNVQPQFLSLMEKISRDAESGKLAHKLGVDVIGWMVYTEGPKEEKIRPKRSLPIQATPVLNVELPTLATATPTRITEDIEIDSSASMYAVDYSEVKSGVLDIQPSSTIQIQPTEYVHEITEMEYRSDAIEPTSVLPPEEYSSSMHTPPLEVIAPNIIEASLYPGCSDDGCSQNIASASTVYMEPTEVTVNSSSLEESNESFINSAEFLDDSAEYEEKDDFVSTFTPEDHEMATISTQFNSTAAPPSKVLQFYTGDVVHYNLSELVDHLRDEDEVELMVQTDVGPVAVNCEWYQLDEESLQIVGIPLAKHVGSQIWVISVLTPANDLVHYYQDIEVVEQPMAMSNRTTHEIAMVLDLDYEEFMCDPTRQMEVVNTIAQIFNDQDTSNINIVGIEEGSVVVKWANKTAINHNITTIKPLGCPKAKLESISKAMLTNKGKIRKSLNKAMADLNLIDLVLTAEGACADVDIPTWHMTKDVNNIIALASNEDDISVEYEYQDDSNNSTADYPEIGQQAVSENNPWYQLYLPITLICLMIIIAAIVAIILIQREKSEKQFRQELKRFEEIPHDANRSSHRPIIMNGELSSQPLLYANGSTINKADQADVEMLDMSANSPDYRYVDEERDDPPRYSTFKPMKRVKDLPASPKSLHDSSANNYADEGV